MATLVLAKVGLLVEIVENGGDGKLVDRGDVKATYSTNTEVQTVALTGFGGTDSYKITYNGSESALVTRGTNDTAAGIKVVIEAIPGFTGTVTVTSVSDAGFIVTFSVSNPGVISITSATGCSGTVTTPADTVVFMIKGVTYTYEIGQITVNSVVLSNYATFLTNMAVTFG